jgi:hypothetical protein
MKFIEGKNRTQIPLFVDSLTSSIDSDNEIRTASVVLGKDAYSLF